PRTPGGAPPRFWHFAPRGSYRIGRLYRVACGGLVWGTDPYALTRERPWAPYLYWMLRMAPTPPRPADRREASSCRPPPSSGPDSSCTRPRRTSQRRKRSAGYCADSWNAATHG